MRVFVLLIDLLKLLIESLLYLKVVSIIKNEFNYIVG